MPRPPPADALRVLVVDDNAHVGRIFGLLLSAWGHEPRTATDGRDALAVAAEFLPDVVLLDLGLPGMDGCEVAYHLHALPRLRDVVLLAMTGTDDDDLRLRAAAAGCASYIVKPADLNELGMLLNALAQGKATCASAV
ncbi:MAG TPA: response regulator [Gemmataceae bacterium]|nr:response regulator [Gemmataceae bacterium]